jgi:hypothetical protein
MSLLVQPVDGPSPNVGSGATAPYGIPTTTADGLTQQGTGVGLGPNGLAGTTIVNHETEVLPSTIPVPAISPSSPNVNCGKPAAFAGVAATSITNLVPDTN